MVHYIIFILDKDFHVEEIFMLKISYMKINNISLHFNNFFLPLCLPPSIPAPPPPLSLSLSQHFPPALYMLTNLIPHLEYSQVFPANKHQYI